MKNKDKWKPSKYIIRNGKLLGSRNPDELSISSRVVADATASLYNKYIRRYAKGKLLDLGCGKVPFYGICKKYVDEYIAVDWENTLHENPHLDFVYDLNKKLPFKDKTFDTIILSDVIEHIPEPDKLFKEIYRIMKTKGIILLNTPFFYWLHEKPYDYYRYTEFALLRLSKLNGFKVIKIDATGGILEIISDLLSKILIRTPIIGIYIASFLQFTTLQLIKIKLIKDLSLKTAKLFPLGYFMIATKFR